MLICSLYFFAYPLPEYTAVFINEKMGATPRNSEGCSHLEISEKDLLNVIIILFMSVSIKTGAAFPEMLENVGASENVRKCESKSPAFKSDMAKGNI